MSNVPVFNLYLAERVRLTKYDYDRGHATPSPTHIPSWAYQYVHGDRAGYASESYMAWVNNDYITSRLARLAAANVEFNLKGIEDLQKVLHELEFKSGAMLDAHKVWAEFSNFHRAGGRSDTYTGPNDYD